MDGIRNDILEMALQIADETAISDIEVYGNPAKHNGTLHGVWYDTGYPSDDDAAFLQRSTQYAIARNLVITHPQRPHLVKIKQHNQADNTTTGESA